ncbi:polysaccharide biosynthesis/export family protein [Paraurantiacibacter namhicola]|nr:polysaccharide biosynthesis/export family protein [Paraurantiacibacter namhicola]
MAALACALLLCACQQSLESTLPAGDAAYAAVAVPDAGPVVYALQVGDRVDVRVFQEADLSVEDVAIDETGSITLPLVGSIQAAGRTTQVLAKDVERAYGARFLRDPYVTVVLRAAVARTVSVEGEVERPGVYAIQPGQTLLTAMALSGSPTDTAKLDEVLIFRTVNGERFGGRFDINEIRSGRMPDPALLPGDVIVVGFSAARGRYQDFLRAVPILGIFGRF